jgi:hypothetical protein
VFIRGFSNGFGLSAGSGALDKFLEQKLRKAYRVVTHDSMLLEQIIEQAAHAEALQFSDIHAYRLGATRAVASRDFGRDGLIACHGPI